MQYRLLTLIIQGILRALRGAMGRSWRDRRTITEYVRYLRYLCIHKIVDGGKVLLSMFLCDFLFLYTSGKQGSKQNRISESHENNYNSFNLNML